ncbi:leucine--tRNA ligase [candidate division WS6 bacterium RIFOXYC1_FULL_33_9]|nr:MAG: leucine--tRNA ligase [candidate division WS6 bacterium RIFOXYC1_FULL_33_9]
MSDKYSPKNFESKWQQKWFSDMKYEAKDLLTDKPKYYLLVEFPYPSGPGMHIGHTRNYSMMDAVARLRRMKGFNVMFPMGWDAFGLPTENYAIKVKRPPQEITNENIENFRRQLKSLGISFDWSREVNTSEPSYYKWTQWIFLKLFEKGLAYKSEMPINWCPNCKVGCANEEVIDSRHERCGTLVEKRSISQWVLKITEYADRLDEDLDSVNFPDAVKALQRNWIGKKTWYDIQYKVENSEEVITVSTTRPDTQFGSTFVVLAPENEILTRLMNTMSDEKRKEIGEYIKESKRKTTEEREAWGREKSGVFTGIYCINSITGNRLPIWVADFVLTTVGTGAVVGVPAHDERDFEFAMKYALPVIRVIEGPDGNRSEVQSIKDLYTGEGSVFNSGFLDGFSSEDARVKVGEFIEKEKIGEVTVRYHLHDWIFSRQHYWGEPIPIVHCENCGMVPVPESELPVELPKVESYEPTDTGESPLANITEWVNIKCPKCGGNAKRETDTMPNWAGSSWYYLRYCDPKNDKEFVGRNKSDYWMQVDHYEGGQEHITLHLLYSRFWHKVLYDLGYVRDIEPYYARSIHGIVLGEGGVKMSKSLGNIIGPDDLINTYGADVTRAYMMFMGPYEGNVEWSTRTIQGVRRFVSRYYDFLNSAYQNRVDNSENSVKIGVNRLVKKIEGDILEFKFNTAIASLMEFYNKFSNSKFDNKDLEKLIILSAPVFPHISEEIWCSTMGKQYSVHDQKWPVIDEKLLEEDSIEIPVQINGKVRGKVTILKQDSEEKIREIILTSNTLGTYLSGVEIKKFIYVPERIVSIIS